MKILCSGPGPHQPANGLLGESDRPLVAGMRCAAPACEVQPDPVALAQERTETSLRSAADAALADLTAAGKAPGAFASNAERDRVIRLTARVVSAVARLYLRRLDGQPEA